MTAVEAVTTIEEGERTAEFGGFAPEDFAVFEVEGFSARMPLLRERVKPKLVQIGTALTERLSEALGETVYPHVAQHLRRTVNPPVETWVTFARNRRAYKPFVHLRVGISAERVRVTAFCEDYADDKLLFADNLERRADVLSDHFIHHPAVCAYEILNEQGAPKSGRELDADTLRVFAARMRRVKGQHAVFGIPFSHDSPVVQSGPKFLDAVVEAAHVLRPLYDCGRPE